MTIHKIFVHIGPHKTATTFLQTKIFPTIDDKVFLGRYSSIENSKNLYFDLMDFCCRSKRDLGLGREVHKKLIESLSKSDLILSDEWLSSNYDGFYFGQGCTWDEKLVRLGLVLEGLEYTIILSKRKKIDNLFSIFCEFTEIGYENEFKNFKEFCYHSLEVEAILNVEESINNIFKNGRIRVISFELLNTSAYLYFRVLEDVLDASIAVKSSIINSKVKSPFDVQITKKNPLSLYIKKTLTSIRVLKRFRFLYDVLRYLNKFFSSPVIIKKPSELESMEIKKILYSRK